MTDKQIKQQLIQQTHKYDKLQNKDIWAYGIGHFINDLCSTCWFNYLLFFLKIVVNTPAASAAILSGQIADAIATPIVGYFSDKFQTRIGKRKPWYIGGIILIVVTFLPTFQNIRHYFPNTPIVTQYLYYCIFPSLFNFGWASVQISHMSLVPSMTCSRKRRDKLNNLRNTFTFVANFAILFTGLFLFKFMNNSTLQFAILSFTAIGAGLICTFYFIYRINQPKLSQQSRMCQQKLKKRLDQLSNNNSVDGTIVSQIQKQQYSWTSWFYMPSFYIYGLSYMGVRLYTNLFVNLMPFYLIYVMQIAKQQQIRKNNIPFEMAAIPLITYFFSVLGSSILPKMYLIIGRKKSMFIGGLLAIAYSVIMILLDRSFNYLMYVVAAISGFSQCIVLCTGINLISEVVGSNSQKGAFVFGVYSFLDKISCGIAIFIISTNSYFSLEHYTFVKYISILIPLIACIIATIIVILSPVKQYKKKKHQTSTDTLNNQLVI